MTVNRKTPGAPRCPVCDRPVSGREALNQRLRCWPPRQCLRLVDRVLELPGDDWPAPLKPLRRKLAAAAANGWSSAAEAQACENAYRKQYPLHVFPPSQIRALSQGLWAWRNASRVEPAQYPMDHAWSPTLTAVDFMRFYLMERKDPRLPGYEHWLADNAAAIDRGATAVTACEHPATIPWSRANVPARWRAAKKRTRFDLAVLFGDLAHPQIAPLVQRLQDRMVDARVQADEKKGITLGLRFLDGRQERGVYELRLEVPAPLPAGLQWPEALPAGLIAYSKIAGNVHLLWDLGTVDGSGIYPMAGKEVVRGSDEFAHLKRLAKDFLGFSYANSDCMAFHRTWRDASGDPVIVCLEHEAEFSGPTPEDLSRWGFGHWLLNWVEQHLC